MISEVGFSDQAAAKRALHYLRQPRVAGSVAQLLDALDHPLQPDCDKLPVVRDQRVDLAKCDGESAISNGPVVGVGSGDVRQHQQLQRVDTILHLLKLVLRDFGHGQAPEPVGFENPTAAAEAAHRLSENRK